MAVDDDIFEAFLTTLDNSSNLAALGLTQADVALPGMVFTEPTPSGNTVYLRPYHMPAGPPSSGVAFASKKTHYGFFQVSIFQAKGSGEMRARSIGSGLISLFKSGTVLTKNTTKVHVLVPPYLLPVIPEEKWTHLPVRVQYSCYAPNPA